MKSLSKFFLVLLAACSSGSSGNSGTLPPSDGGTKATAPLTVDTCTASPPLPSASIGDELAVALDASALYLADSSSIYRYTVQRGASCQLAQDTSFGTNGVLTAPALIADLAVDPSGGLWELAVGGGVVRISPGGPLSCDNNPGTESSFALKSDGTGGYVLQGENGGPFQVVPFTIGASTCTFSAPVILTGSKLTSALRLRIDATGRFVIAGKDTSASPSPIEIYDVTGKLVARSQTTTDYGSPYGDAQWIAICGNAICAEGQATLLRFGGDGSFLGSTPTADEVGDALASSTSTGFIHVGSLNDTPGILRFTGF